MLEFEISDSNITTREGITCLKCDSSITVEPPVEKVDFCFCNLECESPLLVFAGDTDREKDFFTLYHKSKDESAIIQFFINKIELVDVTHGKSIPNGFEVDFTKIFNTLGGGDYTLKKVVTEWAVETVTEWGLFRVAPFDLSRADGTVKIEAFQTGNFENGFDFENENVKFSLRIDGTLTNKNEVLELLDTPDGRRNDIQVHDRFWNEYDLIFDSNKYGFMKLLLKNMLFGTQLFVSDYSLSNQHKEIPFNRVPLRLVETDSDHIKGTNTTSYSVKLRDSLRNGVKHPFIDC